MNQKNNTVLVTGGAGFIGSHLCDALLARGMRVICLDNLITGTEINLQNAKKNSAFQFIHHDVISSFERSEHIDFIYHLASPASVPDYQSHPLETARVNSLGTENLLKLASKHGARFLYTSTSEIYGDPREHPQKESYWGNVNPVGPRACYDESKRYGEMITTIYQQKYDVDTRIVRIFNTYGPRMRQDDGRVISNFINQAITGSPITIYGDGNQTRSFCYITDMVTGLIAMMENNLVRGEIVNIGNPHEIKIKDIAEKIKIMNNSKSEIIYKPLPADDPKERRPDIAKAKALLGWELKTALEHGLAKTIEYYRNL